MTEAAHAVLELGDVAGDGEEQVTVYIEEVMEDGDTVQAYTEGQEISVEELQQVCIKRGKCAWRNWCREWYCAGLRWGTGDVCSGATTGLYWSGSVHRLRLRVRLGCLVDLLGHIIHITHRVPQIMNSESASATNHHFRVFFGGGFFEKYVHPFSEKGTPSLGSPGSTVI